MTTKYLISFFLFFTLSINASAASFEEGREAYFSKDYKKALSILKPLAVKGNAKAQVTLGTMYDFGHGVDKDVLIAVEWYEKAAAQGNSLVQHDLGVKYFRGMGIAQNYEKAAAWWRMAADNGVAESQYNLGLMYVRGLYFEKDNAKAINWYSKAASQGHANAQYNLGVMYSLGQGVPQDYERGLAFFRDAAEQDIAQAQYNLAVLFENGRGTDDDMVRAKKWYKRASEAGVQQATQRLLSLNANDTDTEVASSSSYAPAPKEATQNTTRLPAPVASVKPPPENHEVISGDTIEKVAKPQKEEEPVEPLKIAKTYPVQAEKEIVEVEPIKEAPETTVEVTVDTSYGIRDSSWIQAQDPGHYVLQMIAFGNEDNAHRYVENLNLDGDKAVYKSLMSGKTIYKVIYGNFDNHKASLRGRRALPPKYRETKPFPRSFEFIQNEIQE